MRRKYRNTASGRRHGLPGQKLRGCFQERVQRVGPERFAIVSVDCGKAEAKAMVTDFYGNVRLAPFPIAISRAGLDDAARQIRLTIDRYAIQDLVCAIETTGRYHRPVAQAFQAQGWETREVHPFTSKLIRQAADADNKTDDIDLWAIRRAAVQGLAMEPERIDETSLCWRLLVRHRRDLVEKAATLKVQLQEAVEAYLPGYTALWQDFWESPAAAAIAVAFPSAVAMRQAGTEALRNVARAADARVLTRTIDRILAWTHHVAPADAAPEITQLRARSLWTDLRSKQAEIRPLELEIAEFLCASSYVVLVTIPGINVVAASDYGAELGPISNYAKPTTITGRAGLYPSRYQSAAVDRADGPLVHRANRALRGALMRVARNLARVNHYFMGLATSYSKRQPDCDPRVMVASRFARISYHMVAGGQPCRHPCAAGRETALRKLIEFCQAHDAESARITRIVTQAVRQLPAASLAAEYQPLSEELNSLLGKRQKRRVSQLCEILPIVLLRMQERISQSEQRPEAVSEPQKTNTEEWTHGS